MLPLGATLDGPPCRPGVAAIQPRQSAAAHVDRLLDARRGLRQDERQAHGANLQRLLLLAKHYATELLDGALFFYVTSSSGSTDWRMRHYADRRLHRIVKLLGESAIAQVWQEVEAHFEKKMSAAAWEKFCKWRKGE